LVRNYRRHVHPVETDCTDTWRSSQSGKILKRSGNIKQAEKAQILSYEGMDDWDTRFYFEEKMSEVIQKRLKQELTGC